MDSSFDIQSQNLALVTLKERCHFLKQQLRDVDAENIKLKVQISQNKIGDAVVNEDSLTAEVERLRKEKEQLANQVRILATENSNMWSRLSRLTVVNRNLTRRFTTISDKLEKYGINSLSESEADGSSSSCSKDYRKDLEEMSLKLINNIKLEKTELEKQYAQMVELHKTDADVPAADLAFSSMDADEDTMLVGVRKHASRLNQIKRSLKLQQTALGNALAELKKLKERAKSSPSSSEPIPVVEVAASVNPPPPSVNPSEGRYSIEERDAGLTGQSRREETVRAVSIQPTVEDRVPRDTNEQVCPMCGQHIPGPAEVFYEHVSSHFDDEDAQAELSSFVHVPNQS